jgi:hypothetical protein
MYSAHTYVTRWFTSSQIVIIHTGQIVMNQTHGVNHFQSHGGWHGDCRIVRKHFRGGQTQNGSNALATRHQTVLHGFHNLGSLRFFANQTFIECFFNEWKLVENVLVQVKLDFYWSVCNGCCRLNRMC